LAVRPRLGPGGARPPLARHRDRPRADRDQRRLPGPRRHRQPAHRADRLAVRAHRPSGPRRRLPQHTRRSRSASHPRRPGDPGDPPAAPPPLTVGTPPRSTLATLRISVPFDLPAPVECEVAVTAGHSILTGTFASRQAEPAMPPSTRTEPATHRSRTRVSLQG